MIFHIAVCSPDPVLRGRVQRHCMEYYARRADACIVEQLESATALLQQEEAGSRYELYLIELPAANPCSGLQAAAELRRRGVRAPLAFLAHTTAYAYEAFRVDAMQYLHIPFRPEQLTALLDRATEPEYGPVIPVATAMGLRALPFADIEYLECTHHVVHYHLASGEDVASLSLRVPFSEVAKPLLADARSCGTTASLCGIEQALEKNDKTALDYAVKRDLLLHTAMAFLQGFPMLNCGDEIAQRNGWDYKNDPDRVEDSRNLHRTKFNWEDAKQRTRKGTLQNQLWQGMEQLRQMRADPCFAPDAWVTTWDSHNPGVLALVRKRGEETLVGLFNFTEYPAGASLDALGGEYQTADGASVWLADVELEPYQALLVKNK